MTKFFPLLLRPFPVPKLLTVVDWLHSPKCSGPWFFPDKQVVFLPNFFILCVRLVTQLCPTLCDPIDRSPPGSSVPGILQARILEWILSIWATREPQFFILGTSLLCFYNGDITILPPFYYLDYYFIGARVGRMLLGWQKKSIQVSP